MKAKSFKTFCININEIKHKYFKLLQLDPKERPTSIEIKSNYKKLVMIYHPDLISSKDQRVIKEYSHKFSDITE